MDSFHDEIGAKYQPAILVVRRSAEKKLRHDLEAIVAFRNAVAMSVLLGGRARMIAHEATPEVSWSDTFEFHPARVGRSGRVVLQSPAKISLVSDTASLWLTHSAFVPLAGRRLWPDHFLFRALGKAWKRRFAPVPKADAFSSRLFRSLEVAYQASAVGAKNESSLHEYGTQIALWVSACEILAWPEQRHANLTAVLALLAKYPGGPDTIRKRYRGKVSKKSTPLSAPQRAYAYMYDARNRFLHGERVAVSTMLTRKRRETFPLPPLASIVYRCALVAYLSKRYSVEAGTIHQLSLDYYDHSEYDTAFAVALGYHRRPNRSRMLEGAAEAAPLDETE